MEIVCLVLSDHLSQTWQGTADLLLLSPAGEEAHRWTKRHFQLGLVKIRYKLSAKTPPLGHWKILATVTRQNMDQERRIEAGFVVKEELRPFSSFEVGVRFERFVPPKSFGGEIRADNVDESYKFQGTAGIYLVDEESDGK